MKNMKKQLSENRLKNNPVASKSLLREINERIINAFINIEKHDHHERFISKELNWLAIELEKNWENLNPIHIATLLNNLGNLEIIDQSIAIDIINLGLKRCAELLASLLTITHFTEREIAQIFNALPKLPVPWSKHKNVLSFLLKRASVLASKGNFDARDSANILGGLSKLSMDLLKHRVLVKNLLQVFEASKEAFSKLDSVVLNELWQFCIYTKAKIASEKIDEFIVFIDNELKKRDREVITPSLFQHTIYSLLLKLLADDFVKEVTEECPIGAYSLDIVFPEQKLNIEIDGPYHYRDRKLKRIHQFRDFILQAYDNWKIIRIPYFEWEQLPENTQAKVDYLLKKLASHSYLFNQTSLERLKTIDCFLEVTKEDVSSTGKQIINQPFPELASATMDTHGIFKQIDLPSPLLQQKPDRSLTNATAVEPLPENDRLHK